MAPRSSTTSENTQKRAAGIAYAGFFEANPQYLEVFAQARAEFRGSVPPSHRAYHEELIERFAKILEAGIAADEVAVSR